MCIFARDKVGGVVNRICLFADFPVDPLFIMPQNGHIFIPISIQKRVQGTVDPPTYTINVPAGAIKSKKLEVSNS